MIISQPIKKKIKKHIYFTATGTLNSVHETQDFILDSAQICKIANPKVKCIKPDYCFGSFLTKPHFFEQIIFKYCQAVDKKGKDVDLIKFETLPAVEVLSFEVIGPYKKFKKAYRFVSNWLKAHDINPEDVPEPIREVYIDGPWNKTDPNEFKTELQVVIKKEAK